MNDPMAEQSDKELNVQVATKITLWTPIPNEDGWQSPDGSRKHWPGPPEYSTEIASAMEVVEQMLGEFTFRCGSHDGRTWQVTFSNLEMVMRHEAGSAFDAVERTLPRAICVAARAAKLGSKPVTYSREDIYFDHD